MTADVRGLFDSAGDGCLRIRNYCSHIGHNTVLECVKLEHSHGATAFMSNSESGLRMSAL